MTTEPVEFYADEVDAMIRIVRAERGRRPMTPMMQATMNNIMSKLAQMRSNISHAEDSYDEGSTGELQ